MKINLYQVIYILPWLFIFPVFNQTLTADANGDGAIDSLDVNTVLGQILMTSSALGSPDCNQDGSVDILDVVCLVTIIEGPSPQVDSFSPQAASAGQIVLIEGAYFNSPTGAPPRVGLLGVNGGTVPAPVIFFDANNIRFVVPTGAVDGPIMISLPGPPPGASSDPLQIVPSTNFSLAVVPPTATIIVGQSTSYAVSLESGNGFSGLGHLEISGLPAGISAVFTPQQIRRGQTAILTLFSDPQQPPGSASPVVTATATVDGVPLLEAVGLSLSMEPITTSFSGRTVVADPLQTPLTGVTVTMMGRDGQGNPTACSGQTVSDGAGNFTLMNLPAGCSGEQMVRYDGDTVTSPSGHYASVDKRYTLVLDQASVVVSPVHLPRIDQSETILVQQNAAEDQTFDFVTIPNLSATIYAGTWLSLENGSQPDPFPLTAIQVPGDRLPGQTPDEGGVTPFFVAFQPANAFASQPVAVFYPNLTSIAPGTSVNLLTLDPTLGIMVVYGSGTITADGRQIEPDPDPAFSGHRFGLSHFDWHGPVGPPPPGAPPGPPGECPQAGKPVDLASGLEIMVETDMVVPGNRGYLIMRRTYRTLSAETGPFGLGSGHNYSLRLDTNSASGQASFNLMMPNGGRVTFSGDDGATFRNDSVPAMRAMVISVSGNNEAKLRLPNGVVLHFLPVNAAIGSVLASITDPNSNRVRLVRDQVRPLRILEVVGPAGRKLLMDYDGQDRIILLSDPIGRQVAYTYNAQGTLASVTDPEGGVTSYDYDGQNRLTRVTDARGVVIAQNTYDANGRVAEQLRADGGSLRFEYELSNPGVPTSSVIQTTLTDPMGNRTVYRFNSEGFLIQATDALGQVRVFEREIGTNLLLRISGSGACGLCGDSGAGDMSFTYDGRGNRLTSTNALGERTTLTFEPVFNRVTSFTNALGQTVTYSYDHAGNLEIISDSAGREWSFNNNDFGLLETLTDPVGGVSSFQYDSLSNLVTLTDALGHMTTRQYDGASRLTEQTRPLGRQTTTSYDGLNRPVSETDANGGVTQYAYDEIGNMLSVTDARGNTRSFTYDDMGRIATRTDSRGGIERNAYDLNGNLESYTDRRGQVRLFTYDARDQLVLSQYQDGSEVERHYNPSGLLMRVEDSEGGAFDFSFDPAGRLVRETGPFGTLAYTLDALGRVTRREMAGGEALDYVYDIAGNLISAPMMGASAGFEYDALDRLIRETRSNGVTSDYTQDVLGRVTNIAHQSNGDSIATLTYAYDALGNRIFQTSDVGAPLDVASSSIAFAGDSNRLLARGSFTYAYDENGNRTAKTGPEGMTSYVWDVRNRLKTISEPDGRTTDFRYDFGGNLMEEKVVGPGVFAWRRFLTDDLTNVAFSETHDGKRFSILSGRSLDQHLATIQDGGPVLFAHTDGRNSTVALSDGTGAAAGQLTYGPFGRTNGTPFLFGFTGRVPATDGLYYYRARFYDPDAARFLSEDPIGLSGRDVNFYRYVGNNPVNFRDPMGEFAIFIPILWNIGRVALPRLLPAFLPKLLPYLPRLPALCRLADPSPFPPGILDPLGGDDGVTGGEDTVGPDGRHSNPVPNNKPPSGGNGRALGKIPSLKGGY